ncbi:Siderophore biosynthesis related protein/Acetyltransferase or N-acetylase of ribosomal proteins (CO) [Cupriavidus necator]|uniref:N-acetyltransferase n=1 Tax=Cupriavidus necator (strain ATCC 17699 / DSM 428 / KCTC 22496 / NCIMB 10442 / H16 / Stanier 337) TaxID=381666 RepID=Q0K0K8_CUPNH|nr:GNAT family N-acetyltransferase [Cupriavidus necator]QCC04299.1 N-acetyltransferase [Cupriavidus necator H16]QQB78988.1 acetyltransferase [Cupriavidus necator]WKA43208.1 GNAT family N-acetyltransferase [Cupriavidus necator]CAJ96466.1 siderophore biosynthesis related protein/Acetyltransferase or N-acetylase of ribosomal proteins (CO [Cupriavidus necator H16]
MQSNAAPLMTHAIASQPWLSATSLTLQSRWDGCALQLSLDGTPLQAWQFTPGTQPRLALADTDPVHPLARAATFAACEAVLARTPATQAIALDLPDAIANAMLREGSATRAAGGELVTRVEQLWQLPALWHTGTSGRDYPLQYAMTQGRRHPLRAPKPSGQVYARHIPWLGQVFSMRVADLDADLACFHGWMNDPRVAAFWEEEGDLEKHRDYLSAQLADPHTIPLIGCLDGKPFAYFEVYWAKENRIGPYYDVDDFDRGWHVLIGDGEIRGKAYISAWLPSLMHYMFLDDPRTQRIVGEPRIDHVQQIRNLDRSGFAKVKAFDFPHKRAMLVMLLRERFFGERLWVPQDDGQAQLSGAEPTALAA